MSAALETHSDQHDYWAKVTPRVFLSCTICLARGFTDCLAGLMRFVFLCETEEIQFQNLRISLRRCFARAIRHRKMYVLIRL
jgi:hypothetical protein